MAYRSIIADRALRLLAILALCLLSLNPVWANPAADTLHQAKTLQESADRAYGQSRYAEAVKLYKQSLALYGSLNMGPSQAVIRHQLGFTYRALDKPDRALAQFEANIRHHLDAGDRRSASHYYLYAAQIHYKTGRYDTALEYLERGRQLSDPNDTSRRAELVHWRVMALEATDDLASARELLAAAWLKLPPEDRERYLLADKTRLQVDAAEYAAQGRRNALWVYFASGGLVLLVAVAAWQTPAVRRRLPDVALSLGAVAITVVAAELLLRAFAPPAPAVRHLLHPPNQSITFLPTPEVMPGVDYDESHFTTNEAGLRGEPVPQDPEIPRLVAIGGSSTEALFLDDPDAWPQVLQDALESQTGLPVWVGNGGKSGLNSFSHVVQTYFYARELAPSVILVQAGINDLNQCISGGREAVMANAKQVDDSKFVTQYRQHVFQTVRAADKTTRIRLAEILHNAWRRLNADDGIDVPFDYVVQDQAGLFYVDQRKRRVAAEKVDQAPDISLCLDAFSHNLEKIVEYAGDVPVVFVTQGSLYRDDLTASEQALLWFGAVDVNPFAADKANRYYSATVMQKLLDRYNQRTLDICQRHNLTCLDTEAVLPKTTDSYYDDVHLNTRGSRRLGGEIARMLMESGLLQPQ